MRKMKIYCPADNVYCPYYEEGECGIEDPANECFDFQEFDEKDEYIAENEIRTAFE